MDEREIKVTVKKDGGIDVSSICEFTGFELMQVAAMFVIGASKVSGISGDKICKNLPGLLEAYEKENNV